MQNEIIYFRNGTIRVYDFAHKLSFEFAMIRYGLSASSTCENRTYRRRVVDTVGAENLFRLLPRRIPRNTPTKRFPIFPVAKDSIRPRGGHVRWERAARPLRHPIIFHDLIFTTRNFKLAFHLRELQFAALRPPALSSTPLSISLSVRSPSFHPLPMCCSIPFRRSGRSVTFPICPRRP